MASASQQAAAPIPQPPAPIPQPPVLPRVIFILDNLPIDCEDDFSTPLQDQSIGEQLEHISECLAAAYHQAVGTVLESPLNQAGLVQAVYVNILGKGCFQVVNPQANLFENVTPRAFEAMLDELFTTHRIVNPHTQEELWREIHDIPGLIASLPANRCIIGCVSGEACQNAMNFRNYFTAAPNDQTFVIVVGDFKDGVFEGFINDYVAVSGCSLNPETILSRMCIALHRKLNI